ncbi:hypothetical protein F5Y16DRAFT_129081 [Xylariaceae sp. FL0255]|nr:hypothetical protein F5Y16DRAFT_129081 [Xylariaceae sp. FL0255]
MAAHIELSDNGLGQARYVDVELAGATGSTQINELNFPVRADDASSGLVDDHAAAGTQIIPAVDGTGDVVGIGANGLTPYAEPIDYSALPINTEQNGSAKVDNGVASDVQLDVIHAPTRLIANKAGQNVDDHARVIEHTQTSEAEHSQPSAVMHDQPAAIGHEETGEVEDHHGDEAENDQTAEVEQGEPDVAENDQAAPANIQAGVAGDQLAPVHAPIDHVDAQPAQPAIPQVEQTEADAKHIANQKKFRIIGCVGIAGILVTSAAMKAAGCSLEQIEGLVTIEVTVVMGFLTPVFANSLA